MNDFLRLLRVSLLSAVSIATLAYCSSAPPAVGARDAGPQTPDASALDSATADGGATREDADATADGGTTREDADATADGGALSDDAEAGSPADAALPCHVRTSGADAAAIDPTFQPFTWSAPSPNSIDPPMLAVAPAGDAFVAVAVTDAASSAANKSLYVVLMHITASGAIDGSFGTGGFVTLSSWMALYDLIVDHNGDVVVTGVSPSTVAGFALTALHPDGSTDFSVNSILYGGSEGTLCTGCIAEGADGYLTIGASSILSVARTGLITQRDASNPGQVNIAGCRMAKGREFVSVYCGQGGAGGGEILRYDLHGVLAPSFAGAGWTTTYQDPMYNPWPAPDDSLYVTEEADGTPGPRVFHYLNNGVLDPAYPSGSFATTDLPVLFGAPRCDGKELLVEYANNGSVSMQLLGPSGATFTEAGSVAIPLPDGGSVGYSSSAYGMDANGAVLMLSQTGTSGFELVRILPSM